MIMIVMMTFFFLVRDLLPLFAQTNSAAAHDLVQELSHQQELQHSRKSLVSQVSVHTPDYTANVVQLVVFSTLSSTSEIKATGGRLSEAPDC